MATSTELKNQIEQLQSEIKDIQKSLNRTNDTQDLLDGVDELRNRQKVVTMLQERLQKVEAKEQLEAEEAARKALQDELTSSKAEHEQVSSEFEQEMSAFLETTRKGVKRLGKIAQERNNLNNRYYAAYKELNPDTEDFKVPKLSVNFGFDLKLENPPELYSEYMFALGLLDKAERNLPGINYQAVMFALQFQTGVQIRAMSQPRPQPQQGFNSQAFQAETVQKLVDDASKDEN